MQMLFYIARRRLADYDGTTIPSSRCSNTFALKIRFMKTTYCDSLIGTSASIWFLRR